jgi:small subunit ribosomal protein S16
VGSKKNAIWRVVVADRRSPRDGRFIEMIGHYNPQTEPSQIVIDEERLQHWLERGAEPSNTVKKLMRAQASGGAATVVADEPAAADVEGPGTEAEAATGTEAQGEPAAVEAEPVEGEEVATAGDTAAEGDTESG